jgi:uncharacterized protein YcbK (DUF882 family)
MNRRQFLSTAMLTAAGMTLQLPTICRATAVCRSLSFYHTHTGEKLDIAYGNAGGYDPHALTRINYLLRDFRTGEERPIDPKLLDILFDVRRNFGGQGTFEVISGYRSPKTNKQLCARSSGVAKHSLHMVGKAIDVRLTGVRTKKIQQCALALQRGGVGFYAKSDFVHLDTGRVRCW